VARGVRPLAAAANAALAVLLAPACAACGVPLDQTFGGAVCPACWAGIRLAVPPWCPRCGVPRALAATGTWCDHCRRNPGPVARLRAAGWYDGPLRAILHAFKYDGCPTLARPLGRLMRRHCAEALEDADACVPVPLHWRRRLTRGYNQAALLADELGVPVRRLLRRRRGTPPQASLPAQARRSNLMDAFAPVPFRGGAIRGAVLVLVDDVVTTGSTLAACAQVLAACGAAEVRAVTAARAEVPAGRRRRCTRFP